MSLEDDVVKILIEYRTRYFDGNNAEAAKALGVNAPTLWRWIERENVPRINSLTKAFNALGARVVIPSAGDLDITDARDGAILSSAHGKDGEQDSKQIRKLQKELQETQAKLVKANQMIIELQEDKIRRVVSPIQSSEVGMDASPAISSVQSYPKPPLSGEKALNTTSSLPSDSK